jgi:8-oxo-dGTP diphosphatase
MEKEIIKVAVVAGVVLKKDNKFLLVQENQSPSYGLWNLPAGRVDVGETLEEAAVREAKEESGYDIKIIGQLGIYHESPERAVKHIYAAEITGGDLKFPKDEILDAKWFALEEIKLMQDKLRTPCILEAIMKYEQEFKK